MAREAKVYLSGSLIGTHPKPHVLVSRLKDLRRTNSMSGMVNVSYNAGTNEVIVNADAGRARRPLLVVNDGELSITREEMDLFNSGEITFADLTKGGRIEFIDAEEEEDLFA